MWKSFLSSQLTSLQLPSPSRVTSPLFSMESRCKVIKTVTHLSWWWHLIFTIERTRWGLPVSFLPLWSHKTVLLLLLLLLSCNLARDVSTTLLSLFLWGTKLKQFNNATEPVFVSSRFRKINNQGTSQQHNTSNNIEDAHQVSITCVFFMCLIETMHVGKTEISAVDSFSSSLSLNRSDLVIIIQISSWTEGALWIACVVLEASH